MINLTAGPTSIIWRYPIFGEDVYFEWLDCLMEGPYYRVPLLPLRVSACARDDPDLWWKLSFVMNSRKKTRGLVCESKVKRRSPEENKVTDTTFTREMPAHKQWKSLPTWENFWHLESKVGCCKAIGAISFKFLILVWVFLGTWRCPNGILPKDYFAGHMHNPTTTRFLLGLFFLYRTRQNSDFKHLELKGGPIDRFTAMTWIILRFF